VNSWASYCKEKHAFYIRYLELYFQFLSGRLLPEKNVGLKIDKNLYRVSREPADFGV